MQFFTLAVAIFASASAVYAAPASGTPQDPDKGECNGTSCNFLAQNIPCSQGSTAQSGAGDKTPCDIINFGHGKAYAICPGNA
ncbi:hypothetical protein PG997_010705 [Apiospora hydei]|uniref:Uncharacterized protein n=1 Tax=Apiospora hydei TaxID=1337664 RepID=A0ABR1VH13_9PEZI